MSSFSDVHKQNKKKSQITFCRRLSWKLKIQLMKNQENHTKWRKKKKFKKKDRKKVFVHSSLNFKVDCMNCIASFFSVHIVLFFSQANNFWCSRQMSFIIHAFVEQTQTINCPLIVETRTVVLRFQFDAC